MDTVVSDRSAQSAADRRAARNTGAAILQTALEQFAEHGYDGTSLQQIADHLGVTKAALYYHFRSKDDLLLAVLEPYLADLDALIADRFGRGPDGERDVDQVGRYLDFLLEHRRLLSYLSRDAAALARPAVAARIGHYAAAIAEAVAGSDLSPADQVRVNFLLAGMQGAISAHADAPADELRGPILDAVNAVLAVLDAARSD